MNDRPARALVNHRFFAAGAFVASCALGALSCSSDSAAISEIDNGGSSGLGAGGSLSGGGPPGGAAGSGNGGAAGGGSGGAVPGTTPMLDACNAYLAAQCHRRFACNYDFTDCTSSYQRDCPDVYFSPGSSRTVEGMLACAKEWATFPCDQILMDLAPACATPGTRQPGESCAFSSQCSSAVCNANYRQCGACTQRIAVGSPCDYSDITKSCEPGSSCNGTTCSPSSVTAPMFTRPGDACTTGCTDGVPCLKDASGALRCANPPTAGQPCGIDQLGDPVCARGLVCSAANTCEAGPGAGQPCAPPRICAIDAKCNSSGTCVAKAGPGESCQIDLDCASGLNCRCVPGTSCAPPKCLTVLAAGAACGQPNTVCDFELQCEAGRCVPSDALTVFANLCAGK